MMEVALLSNERRFGGAPSGPTSATGDRAGNAAASEQVGILGRINEIVRHPVLDVAGTESVGGSLRRPEADLVVSSMIKNLGMRTEVENAVAAFADLETQRCWLDGAGHGPNESVEPFDLAIHVLFDDTAIALDPELEVGLVLRNRDEARALKALVVALSRFLDTNPAGPRTDADLESIGWLEVLASARSAHQRLHA